MGVQVPSRSPLRRFPVASRSRCVAFPLLRVPRCFAFPLRRFPVESLSPFTSVQGARGRQPEGRCVPLYWFNHPPNRHPVPVFLHIHWLVPGW